MICVSIVLLCVSCDWCAELFHVVCVFVVALHVFELLSVCVVVVCVFLVPYVCFVTLP